MVIDLVCEDKPTCTIGLRAQVSTSATLLHCTANRQTDFFMLAGLVESENPIQTVVQTTELQRGGSTWNFLSLIF